MVKENEKAEISHMQRCILAAFIIVGNVRFTQSEMKTVIVEFDLLNMSKDELIMFIKKYKRLHGDKIRQQLGEKNEL